MTVFISDTFTDTDGVILQDHTPETGGTWVKRLGSSGNIEITSNEIRASVTTAFYYTNDISLPSADYDITFDWNNLDDTGLVTGVLARFLDNSNFYQFFKFLSGGSFQNYRLVKVFLGSNTTLDSGFDSIVSGIESGKFEISGTTQKGYADGVEVLSSTDSDLTLSGSVGVYMSGDTSLTLDNFITEDTATPTSTNASMQPINVWWQLD